MKAAPELEEGAEEEMTKVELRLLVAGIGTEGIAALFCTNGLIPAKNGC